MRATGIGLFALALVGVCACERKSEQQVGETTTTAGETEEQRAAREQEPLPGAVPGEAPKSAAEMAKDEAAKAVEARKDEEAKKAATDTTTKADEAKARPIVVKKTVVVKKILKPKAPAKVEEPESTTTITAVEIETVPRPTPAQPLEPMPRATPPGGEPLPSDQTAKQPYINRSTTLGNASSGMYTGGQGTYGGRATWGTCCGVQAYPPVPQPYPPPGSEK